MHHNQRKQRTEKKERRITRYKTNHNNLNSLACTVHVHCVCVYTILYTSTKWVAHSYTIHSVHVHVHVCAYAHVATVSTTCSTICCGRSFRRHGCRLRKEEKVDDITFGIRVQRSRKGGCCRWQQGSKEGKRCNSWQWGSEEGRKRMLPLATGVFTARKYDWKHRQLCLEHKHVLRDVYQPPPPSVWPHTHTHPHTKQHITP